jgi:hypothetical protein
MATIARYDIYSRVHKGLRKALFDFAYLAGRTEYADAAERARLKAQAAETIHFLIHHGHIEDSYHLQLLEASLPGSTEHDIHEHERIHDEVFGLQLALDAIEDCATPEECRLAGEEYYLRVNAFIADYLTHMHHEEMTMAPLFIEHCTQEKLQAMIGSITANASPADAMIMLRYTVPAIDQAERAMFVGNIKQVAPAPAFEAVMQTIRPTLNDDEWTTLHTSLN